MHMKPQKRSRSRRTDTRTIYRDKKNVALVVRTETGKSIRKSKIMIHIRVSSENFQFGQFLYFAYINRSLQSSIAIVALLASFLCHVKSFKCAHYQIAKTIRPKICAKKTKICAKKAITENSKSVSKTFGNCTTFSPWAQCVGIMGLDWFVARRE